MSDPHYERILEGLAKVRDGEKFEQCACDLLRGEWPNLIPVPGGGDAGLDGAFVDGEAKGGLIATTGEDVLRNVTENLKTRQKSADERPQVLVVTSQHLTPHYCRKIAERVRELGFQLAHDPYTQQAIADRLYHNSRWCRDLLGLSGRPSALSRIPKGARILQDLPLVGRVDDRQWLESTNGDRLIVGQPGIGKTFLARAFVNEGHGLFAIDDDIGRLAGAIRDQRPGAVVVEDAHLRHEVIKALEHCRRDTGLKFDIVADCWPAGKDELRNALSLSETQCHELKPLSRDEILELIDAAGIGGPNALLHQLVHQAMGCPGRAAMLAHLCFAKGIRDVFAGEALTSWTCSKFSQLVGEQAVQMLAAFALGGSAGMPIDAVADVLGHSLGDVRLCMAKLAMGGVVQELNGHALRVLPAVFQYGLVKQYFFDGPVPLAPEDLFNRAVDRGEALRSVIGACDRGANVPSDWLLRALEATRHDEAWAEYVLCGRNHARMVLDRHPERLKSLARPLLHQIPEQVIPLLLTSAVEDARDLNRATNHPLRVMRDWVSSAEPGRGDVVRRRKLLLDGVSRWMAGGGDHQTALRALKPVLSPGFEDTQQHPGSTRSFQWRSGFATAEELSELAKWWPQVYRLLGSLQIASWKPVLEMIGAWVHPYQGPANASEEQQRIFDDAAEIMLRDVANLAVGRPGILRKLQSEAECMEIAFHVDIDTDFGVLFPRETHGEGHEQERRHHLAAAEALASKWLAEPMLDVVDKLVWCSCEAEAAGIPYSNYSMFVCAKLAEKSPATLPWTDAIIASGGDARLVEQFLGKAVEEKEEGWQDRTAQCLRSDGLRALGVSIALQTADAPESLFEEACQAARKLPEVVNSLCLSDRVHIVDNRMLRLLEDKDPGLAAAAAEGLWLRNGGRTPPPEIYPAWQRAVIAHVGREHHIASMLEKDSDLALAWLRDRAARAREEYSIEDDAIAAASSKLTLDEKRLILRELCDLPNARCIAKNVIGRDVSLYTELVADPNRRFVHLAPLASDPSDEWAELAIVALDAGYSTKEIADCAYCQASFSVGNFSDQCREKAEAWSCLDSHSDGRIREIAKSVAEAARSAGEQSAAREEQEEFSEYYA